MCIGIESFYSWAQDTHPSVTREFLERELTRINGSLTKSSIRSNLVTKELASVIETNITHSLSKTIEQVTQHIDSEGVTVYAAWCGEEQSVYLLSATLAEPDTALTCLSATKEVKYYGYQYISEAVGLHNSFSDCLQQLGWLEVEDEFKMLTITILCNSEQQLKSK